GILGGAFAVERAEVADGSADVRVVDVAIDVVGAVRLGVQPAANLVGGLAQGAQVTALEQGQPFVRRQAVTVSGFPQDGLDRSTQVGPPGGPDSVRRQAYRNSANQLARAAPGQSG